MGQSYQSAAIKGGTTKAFFLKRNVPFSTNTRVKVSYILSILLYASNVWFSNWPNCRKLEKIHRLALKWALNKKFFNDSDYNQSFIYNNSLPISFLLVRNDLLMLKKITTVILPISLMIIGKFSRDHAVTVLQQINF